ncbi:MAG: hypothetical protein MUC86_12210 [Burkholderiaceae bacterium]|nr:hypothetical protein [Burkholderiaceae bacterium]
MATYFRDFADADGISDFTEVPITSTHTDPAWSIVSSNQVQATSASAHNEALCWDDIDGDADRDDVEILSQCYVDSNTASQRYYCLRTSTSGSSRTGYAVRFRTSSFDVYRFIGSTFTQIATASISVSSGTWCWVRFRANGTTIRARYWEDGGSEGGTWNCDTTDSTYSTAGHVGLLKGANTNTQLWRKFGVGTNGDTAPSSGGGGSAALECNISGTATVSAALTTAIQCSASISGTATVSAALTTAIQCAASVSGTATVSASLAGGAAALAASVSAPATVSAALTTAIQCAASVSGIATVSASLAGGAAALAASVSAQATVSVALTTAIRCAASVSGTATVSADLSTTPSTMAASVAGTATVSAALTTAIRCAASVSGTATVTASLAGAAAALAASVSATAAVTSATLTGSAAALAAAVTAQAQAAAALTTAIRLAAIAQASATSAAALTAGPMDVYLRTPIPVNLLGVPAERTMVSGATARKIGRLLTSE